MTATTNSSTTIMTYGSSMQMSIKSDYKAHSYAV